MIQFPLGPGPAQPALPEPAQSTPSAGRPAEFHVHGSHAPEDSAHLQQAAVAALELELLERWNDSAARAAAAADYQLARAAADAGDRVTALQRLHESVLAHPESAQTAQQDAAFDAMKTDVREMVGRVTTLARMRAEASMAEASEALESVHIPDGPGRAFHAAQAYLDLAQAHFDSGSYAGYVLAAQAAAMAQPNVDGSKVASAKRAPAIGGKSLLRPLTRPVRQAARRLWQTLPLLAILLGWLLAGIVAGVASLPFQQGLVAELRQTLFPIWALGLLAMVLLGFVRSIRYIRRPH